MARIIVRHPFKFAHGGHRVEEFEADDQAIDTSAECAELAIAEGWADDADKLEAERLAAEQAAVKPDEEKAEPAAPANKDAAPKRSTKTAA